jgi:hypothetical protein
MDSEVDINEEERTREPVGFEQDIIVPATAKGAYEEEEARKCLSPLFVAGEQVTAGWWSGWVDDNRWAPLSW